MALWMTTIGQYNTSGWLLNTYKKLDCHLLTPHPKRATSVWFKTVKIEMGSEYAFADLANVKSNKPEGWSGLRAQERNACRRGPYTHQRKTNMLSCIELCKYIHLYIFICTLYNVQCKGHIPCMREHLWHRTDERTPDRLNIERFVDRFPMCGALFRSFMYPFLFCLPRHFLQPPSFFRSRSSFFLLFLLPTILLLTYHIHLSLASEWQKVIEWYFSLHSLDASLLFCLRYQTDGKTRNEVKLRLT